MDNINVTPLQIQILQKLASSADHISANELANLFGVSSKTIRQEIFKITSLVEEHGGIIDSRTSKGYAIKIKDHQQFDEFISNLQILPSFLESNGRINTRAHKIIRYLLAHNGEVYLLDIADLLYVNQTTAKKCVVEAKEIIKKFDLEIRSKYRHGMKIVGKEEDIRLCFCYEYHIWKISRYDDELEYEELMGVNSSAFVEIKDLIIRNQNFFENYNLSMYSVEYLAHLIIISAVRNKMGQEIELDEFVVREFTNRNSYYLARRIMSSAARILNVDFTIYDEILIGICFVGLRVSINPPKQNQFRFLNYKNSALDIVNELARVNGFDAIAKDIEFVDQIALMLEGLLIRSRFHIFTSQLIEKENSDYSIMALKMAVQIASIIENTTGFHLHIEEIYRIAIINRPVFGRYPFVYDKKNACVISDIDKRTGNAMAERIMRNFKVYLNEVDVLELYEYIGNKEKYDVVFTSFREEVIYDINPNVIVFYVDTFFKEDKKDAIRRTLLTVTSSGDSTNIITNENLHIFRDLEVVDKDDCLKQISKIIQSDENIDDDIYEDLKKFESYLPSVAVNGAVILSGCLNHTWHASVKVFVLKQPINWGREKTRAKIVVYWDRGLTYDEGISFENESSPRIITELFTNPSIIDTLVKGGSVDLENDAYDVSNKIVAQGSSFN